MAGNRRSLSLYPLFLSAREPASARGELVALKETDMDFNGRCICVQKESLLGNIGATKNGKARNVDMSTQLAESNKRRVIQAGPKPCGGIEKLAEERRDAATVVNEVMEDWLFQSPIGTQIDLE